MPRTSRIDLPHLHHHVIIRGIERRDIFLDDDDRRRFVDKLDALLKETSTRCFAWALMRNHAHFLLMPTVVPLSLLMRRLLTSYAGYFNRKYARSGHVFQNRYKSIICEEEPYFLELVRYIHLNPLRVGAAANVDELSRYPWSGHSVIMGNATFEQGVAEVLGRFAASTPKARLAYLQFMEDGVAAGKREDLRGGGLRRSQGCRDDQPTIEAFDERILGSGMFVEQVQRADPRHGLPLPKLELSELTRRVAKVLSVEEKRVLAPSKTRDISTARGIICYVGVRQMGYTGKDVGKFLCLGSAGVTLAVRRGERALETTQDLAAALEAGLAK